jgi:hypothetical protein
MQGLLGTLRSMDETKLKHWASSNRITLEFLAFVADQEEACHDKELQQQLWHLGSRLMALREGLQPTPMSQLETELQAMAEVRRTGAGMSAPAQRGEGQQLPATFTPFESAIQHTAELGLSSEGMALLQQQAAALETVVGSTRARSLTEVIGRKELHGEVGDVGPSHLNEADAAVSLFHAVAHACMWQGLIAIHTHAFPYLPLPGRAAS